MNQLQQSKNEEEKYSDFLSVQKEREASLIDPQTLINKNLDSSNSNSKAKGEDQTMYYQYDFQKGPHELLKLNEDAKNQGQQQIDSDRSNRSILFKLSEHDETQSPSKPPVSSQQSYTYQYQSLKTVSVTDQASMEVNHTTTDNYLTQNDIVRSKIYSPLTDQSMKSFNRNFQNEKNSNSKKYEEFAFKINISELESLYEKLRQQKEQSQRVEGNEYIENGYSESQMMKKLYSYALQVKASHQKLKGLITTIDQKDKLNVHRNSPSNVRSNPVENNTSINFRVEPDPQLPKGEEQHTKRYQDSRKRSFCQDLQSDGEVQNTNCDRQFDGNKKEENMDSKKTIGVQHSKQFLSLQSIHTVSSQKSKESALQEKIKFLAEEIEAVKREVEDIGSEQIESKPQSNPGIQSLAIQESESRRQFGDLDLASRKVEPSVSYRGEAPQFSNPSVLLPYEESVSYIRNEAGVSLQSHGKQQTMKQNQSYTYMDSLSQIDELYPDIARHIQERAKACIVKSPKNKTNQQLTFASTFRNQAQSQESLTQYEDAQNEKQAKMITSPSDTLERDFQGVMNPSQETYPNSQEQQWGKIKFKSPIKKSFSREKMWADIARRKQSQQKGTSSVNKIQNSVHSVSKTSNSAYLGDEVNENVSDNREKSQLLLDNINHALSETKQRRTKIMVMKGDKLVAEEPMQNKGEPQSFFNGSEEPVIVTSSHNMQKGRGFLTSDNMAPVQGSQSVIRFSPKQAPTQNLNQKSQISIVGHSSILQSDPNHQIRVDSSVQNPNKRLSNISPNINSRKTIISQQIFQSQSHIPQQNRAGQRPSHLILQQADLNSYSPVSREISSKYVSGAKVSPHRAPFPNQSFQHIQRPQYNSNIMNNFPRSPHHHTVRPLSANSRPLSSHSVVQSAKQKKQAQNLIKAPNIGKSPFSQQGQNISQPTYVPMNQRVPQNSQRNFKQNENQNRQSVIKRSNSVSHANFQSYSNPKYSFPHHQQHNQKLFIPSSSNTVIQKSKQLGKQTPEFNSSSQTPKRQHEEPKFDIESSKHKLINSVYVIEEAKSPTHNAQIPKVFQTPTIIMPPKQQRPPTYAFSKHKKTEISQPNLIRQNIPMEQRQNLRNNAQTQLVRSNNLIGSRGINSRLGQSQMARSGSKKSEKSIKQQMKEYKPPKTYTLGYLMEESQNGGHFKEGIDIRSRPESQSRFRRKSQESKNCSEGFREANIDKLTQSNNRSNYALFSSEVHPRPDLLCDSTPSFGVKKNQEDPNQLFDSEVRAFPLAASAAFHREADRSRNGRSTSRSKSSKKGIALQSKQNNRHLYQSSM